MVQVMMSPTPPESRMVMVSPSIFTTQDSVLSTRFPLGLKKKQSNSVISTVTSPHSSVAVPVNEMGASGGTIVSGALHAMSGGVVSTTVIT